MYMPIRIVALLCLLFTASLALACSPGNFYAPTPKDMTRCLPCDLGHYCPGDDASHMCPENTISDSYGATSCVSCPRLSNSERTVCLLADLPEDAREIQHGDVIQVDIKRPYFYITVNSDRQNLTRGSELTFINNIKGFEKSPIIFYSSLISGRPGKENAMVVGKGVNATIYAPNVLHATGQYVVYLNIIPLIGSSIPVTVATYYSLSRRITMDSPVFEQKMFLNEHYMNVVNTVQLTYNNVPANSRVNFTVSVDVIRADMAPGYTLYHSTLPTIVNPNPNNANMAVHSTVGNLETTTSLVATSVEGGPFAVSMEYYGSIYGTLHANIQITPNKN